MRSKYSRRCRAAMCSLLFAVACGRDALEPEEGAFVGRWDGRPWLGDAGAMLLRGAPEGDVLYVFGSAPRGANAFGIRESISAHVVYHGPGVYALGPDDVSFMELTGGDVIAAWYQGSGSPAGILRVSRYDEATGVIEGELRFSASTNSTFASYGHSARFADGKFRTVVTVQPASVPAP